MTTYKYVGRVDMKLKPTAEYLFVEATYNQIYTDALFFSVRRRDVKLKGTIGIAMHESLYYAILPEYPVLCTGMNGSFLGGLGDELPQI